jgi:pyruvate dehydrogenase E1 component alpha subunit
LQAIDKEARSVVDKAVEEAKASPEPPTEEFWTEIYAPGTEPSTMRGVEFDDVHRFN